MTDIIKVPVLEATRAQTEEIISMWREQRTKRLEANRIMEEL